MDRMTTMEGTESAVTAPAKTPAQVDRERRKEISNILFDCGFEDAAEAILTELDDVDGETANWINWSLYEALEKHGALRGKYGDKRAVVWQHCNRARFIAKEKGEKRAEYVLDWLLSDLGYIEISKFVLRAIERLVHEYEAEQVKDEDERNYPSFVSQLLEDNPALAEAVKSGPTNRKASALIAGIKACVKRERAARQTEARTTQPRAHRGYGPQIRRTGKTERKRTNGHDSTAKKRERAERDRQLRESMKNGGKGGPKK